jgi:hypothetical protein
VTPSRFCAHLRSTAGDARRWTHPASYTWIAATPARCIVLVMARLPHGYVMRGARALKRNTSHKKPRPKNTTEHEDAAQIAVVEWARENADQWHCLADLFAVMNSAMVKPSARERFTQMGRLAGVTDLIMLEPRGGYCGMLLEMKREKGGRLSPEQIAFIERHRRRGYFVRVAAGRHEGIAALQEYLALPPSRDALIFELQEVL